MAALRAEGVYVGAAGYPLQHLQPAYSEARQRLSNLLKREVGGGDAKLPVTARVYERLLSLPTFPQGSVELMAQYVAAFRKVSQRWQEIPQVEETEKGPADRSRRLIR